MTESSSIALGHQAFGAMRLGPKTTGDPDRDPTAVILHALDQGITMIDTADAYQNEELVGAAISRRRDDVTLASKFGLVWDDEVASGFQVRADPSYVRQACEASLRRLGTDMIDLYYLHHRSDQVPIEDTIGAMAELKRRGMIRAIGLSNVTAEDLRRAHQTHPVTALQEEWSILGRGVESDLVPVARELGITVVAHSPTGHGLLHRPGKNDDQDVGPGLAATLDRIAESHDANAGQIALAWVHHRQKVHGVRVVPLPGTTSIRHLRENLRAAEIQLSDEDLDRIEAHSAGGT